MFKIYNRHFVHVSVAAVILTYFGGLNMT